MRLEPLPSPSPLLTQTHFLNILFGVSDRAVSVLRAIAKGRSVGACCLPGDVGHTWARIPQGPRGSRGSPVLFAKSLPEPSIYL